MNNIAPQDLRVFVEAARRASFAAAAEDLGASPAYVSKRIAIIEQTLKVKLFHRSTRRVSLTERGERILVWARRVLDTYDQVNGALEEMQGDARGTLRIAASSGLGRNHVAPVLSDLVKLHPGLEVHLEILDRSVDLINEDFDIDVRVGDVREPHLVPHHLAPGRRILCAAPSYLESHGEPQTIGDLARHSCLLIRERDRGPVFQPRPRRAPLGHAGPRHHAPVLLGRGEAHRSRPPRTGVARLLAARRRLGGDQGPGGKLEQDTALYPPPGYEVTLRTFRAGRAPQTYLVEFLQLLARIRRGERQIVPVANHVLLPLTAQHEAHEFLHLRGE